MRKILLLMILATLSIWAAENTSSYEQYYQAEEVKVDGGVLLERFTISSPPSPPLDISRATVSTIDSDQMGNTRTLTATPAFSWSFGCSATSGAMIAGYYDRTGYLNVYTGPTNGGLMPLDNSSWGTWVDSGGDTRAQCPLSATRDGLDGRSGRGHVDDYWIKYQNNDDDPFITNDWTEHTYNDCTADFMKTNQTTNHNNSDGATSFYSYTTSGDPLTAEDMESYGIHNEDGAYGLKLFFESRDYTVTTLFTQKIDTQAEGGFSFEQYKAEIDAGYPVMIHLEGHSIVGVGYDDSNNEIYLHDTWDYDTHSMTWGGSYAGMDQKSVSVLHLASIKKTKNDFNADGRSDIFWRHVSNDKTYIWYMNEDGSHTATYTGRFSTDYEPKGTGDFNADGRSDIFWRHVSNDKTYIWYMNADGSHTATYTGRFSTDYEVKATGDYNGDGRSDIFWRHVSNDKTYIWYMNEDGSHTATYTGRFSVDYAPQGTGDFNGDGRSDIFWRHVSNDKTYIWYMNADGSHTATYTGRFSVDYEVKGTGDFNADGRSDIFWRHVSNDKTYIWYMNADGSHTATYTGRFSTDYEVKATGDYNGDGRSDIFWRHVSNDKTYIWYMNEDGSHTATYTGRFSTDYAVAP